MSAICKSWVPRLTLLALWTCSGNRTCLYAGNLMHSIILSRTNKALAKHFVHVIYFIFTTPGWVLLVFPFTDDVTKTQREWMASPKTRLVMVDPGFELRPLSVFRACQALGRIVSCVWFVYLRQPPQHNLHIVSALWRCVDLRQQRTYGEGNGLYVPVSFPALYISSKTPESENHAESSCLSLCPPTGSSFVVSEGATWTSPTG